MTREGYISNDSEYIEPIKVFKCEEHRKSYNTKNNASIIATLSFIFLIISTLGIIFSDINNIIGFSFIGFMISFMSFFGSLILFIHEDDVCKNIYED